MARQPERAAVGAGGAPAGWVWGPWVDLGVGCAGWTLPLLALTYLLSRSAWLDVAFAFSLLTLVCNHPHYMATVHRAFGDRASAAAYRMYTVHLSVLFAMTLVAAHLYAPLVPLLFTLYVCWSPWHYSGQNFGLLLLFTRRARVEVTPTERRLLLCAFGASYLAWLLTVQTQVSTDPYIWSLDLSAAVGTPIGLGLAGVFAASGVAALARLVGRGGWRAIAPCAVLLASQALWFVAPLLARATVGRGPSPLFYTTGVLAFMHCAQYLWITSFYARREAGAAWRPFRYATVLVLGGIALFVPGPWVASAAFGLDFRESTLIFIALVNLHHFILDGALWKLRDRRVAAVLAGPDPVPAAMRAPLIRLPRPALQWGLAAVLVLIAAANIAQQWLTLDGADARRLELARRLNPNDTRVDVRTAERLAAAQQPDAALRVLARDVDLRPANAAALRLYGTLLVAAGRYTQAATHYQAVERSVGLDPAGLVNVAVLSIRDGRPTAAADALRRALAIDPDLPAAHLDLAGVCLQSGDADCALRHYEAYLASADVRRDRAWATAALNAASAAALAREPQVALELLGASAALAQSIGAPDLVALADGQAAALGATRRTD